MSDFLLTGIAGLVLSCLFLLLLSVRLNCIMYLYQFLEPPSIQIFKKEIVVRVLPILAP